MSFRKRVTTLICKFCHKNSKTYIPMVNRPLMITKKKIEKIHISTREEGFPIIAKIDHVKKKLCKILEKILMTI